MTERVHQGGAPPPEPEHRIRVQLPDGVNFEVPRDYARCCNGRPVRVAPLDHAEAAVLVAWTTEALRFANQDTMVEFERKVVRGLVVNLREQITGMTACTLRIVFEGPAGSLETLPVLSANPVHTASFQRLVSTLSTSRLPVPIVSSVKDLVTQ